MNKYYTPSKLIAYINSPYGAWYDRANSETNMSLQSKVDESDPLQEILSSKGTSHEKQILQQLKDKGLNVREYVDNFFDVAKAINENVDVIFQAKLQTEHFSGDADFIIKEDDGYIVYDTKLAKSAKPYMIYQVCIYTEALGSLLGELPKHFKIITGTGEVLTFKTNDYFYYFKQIEKEFLKFHKNFSLKNPPRAEDYSSHGNWSSLAEEELLQKDHLSLVATMSKRNIQKLNDAKIMTRQDLVKAEYSQDINIDPVVFEKLKRQCQLQLESEHLETPKYEIISPINLPPETKEDIFFDMEGYPLHGQHGLEYLFGVTKLNGEFIDFWAHNETEEKKAFSDFIDFAFQLFTKNPKMKIYHYANYEVAAMKKLSTLYGVKEFEVDTFLRNDTFVDLYKIVKESLILGTPNYSIKSVEKIFRSKRNTEVANAGDSVVAYANWLASGEEKDYRKSKLLNDIRDYNKDDCDSTLELALWLRSKVTTKLTAKDKATVATDEIPLVPNLQAQLREELLAKYPNDPIFENVTYLLDFNKRKDKPMWWRYFTKHELSTDELYDDLDCISLLTFESSQDKHAIYTYDPAEETKLRADSNCVTIENQKVKIVAIDTDRGIVEMSFSQPRGQKEPITFPSSMSIMAFSFIPTKSLDAVIEDFVRNYHTKPNENKAIKDFFKRSRPTLKKNKVPLIDIKKPLLDEAIQVMDLLDHSTFCIQGPPGTGKSYTASHMIAHALKNGQSVGIMSNSHKAIDNLLSSVVKQVKSIKNLGILRINNDKEKVYESPINRQSSFDTTFLDNHQLMAGTVFSFSKCPKEHFDYLFIDEAGQVSLANLVAGGACAKNIILMGDQQQLPQPIEGTHPLDTAKSLLDYYMQDKATIDNDMGLFLNVTYRMHSSISNFISESIYDSKLQTDKKNDNRIIDQKESHGIIYVPVEHVGNTQASSEEIHEILKLTKSLLGKTKKDKEGKDSGTITIDDILYIAPYNLQVSLLKEALDKNFGNSKVGSIDKFQGQEEAIVIISMCTSSEEDVGSRGIDFLFSLNRLNVAITRAQSLAYIVASPNLINVRTNSLEKMKKINFWCKLMKYIS